jgi:hypothetical protein
MLHTSPIKLRGHCICSMRKNNHIFTNPIARGLCCFVLYRSATSIVSWQHACYQALLYACCMLTWRMHRVGSKERVKRCAS